MSESKRLKTIRMRIEEMIISGDATYNELKWIIDKKIKQRDSHNPVKMEKR